MTFCQGKKEALDLISRVRSLELKSREAAEGALIGLHRSRHRGSSIEFSEHRAYSPGDEIRLIDWKIFGKTDRYFIKQFEDETRVQAYLLLDASGSMAYPEDRDKTSKFEYGSIIAAALAYLLLGQGDAVGLALINRGGFNWMPARAGERHFPELVEMMARAEPEGQTRLGPLMFELQNRISRKSLVILVSDFFDPEKEIESSLKLLRLAGNELVLFQLLAPEEMQFPFDRITWFEGLENEGRVLIDPGQLRRKYLNLLKSWQDRLQRLCQEQAADFELFLTSQNPGKMLCAYLVHRSQTQRRRARP